jgi:hypothetical protein
MAAPKGNEFWKLRSKHGRDKIFESPEIFIEAAYEYFAYCNETPWFKNEAVKSGFNVGQIVEIPTQKPYTLGGLCIFLHIDRQTFINYEKNKAYKDFFEVFTHVREIIETNQLEGATVGAFNANIIGRLLGLVDKTENKLVGDSESLIVVTDKETAKNVQEMIDKFKNEKS